MNIRYLTLHLIAALKRPRNWRFHLAGIQREFARLSASPLVARIQLVTIQLWIVTH